MTPCKPPPAPVPLVCTYAEFLALRRSGIPFVGWRSGLCDIAAASPAPMAVLYPHENFASERAWCPDLTATFGLKAMGVDADCVELVCDSAGKLDLDTLAAALG